MEKIFKINSNTLFYTALVLFEMSNMFAYVNGIKNFCNMFANTSTIILLFCCFIQSKKYSFKSIIMILLAITVFAINAFTINDKRLLFLLLFCLACKNLKFKNILEFNWKCQLIFLIIVVITYSLGLTENYFMYRSDGTVRSSMGFAHPNTFGIYIFSICCQYIFCRYNKRKILYIFPIVLLSTLIIIKFSDSRSSAYSLIIIYLFTVYARSKEKKINTSKLIEKTLVIFPIFLTAFSLYFANIYDKNNTKMYKLNMSLSGRISAAHRVMSEYDVKPFGQHLELTSTKEALKLQKNAFVLDNAYIKLVYQYGAFVTILFIIFYCATIGKAIKHKNYILVCMLIIYAIRGLTENILFNIYGNIFLLSFATIIYGDDFIIVENTKLKKGGLNE